MQHQIIAIYYNHQKNGMSGWQASTALSTPGIQILLATRTINQYCHVECTSHTMLQLIHGTAGKIIIPNRASKMYDVTSRCSKIAASRALHVVGSGHCAVTLSTYQAQPTMLCMQ